MKAVSHVYLEFSIVHPHLCIKCISLDSIFWLVILKGWNLPDLLLIAVLLIIANAVRIFWICILRSDLVFVDLIVSSASLGPQCFDLCEQHILLDQEVNSSYL